MDEHDIKTVFSNKSDDWTTPDWLYEKLNKEFKFTLDPAASNENHKCQKYYTLEQDGLAQDWKDEIVFCNPPYSQNKEWLKKFYHEAKTSGATVVALLPVRTCTKWFHGYCMDSSIIKEIRFFKGRLKFSNQKHGAPFPSMLVIFQLPQKTNALFPAYREHVEIKAISNKA